MNNYIYNQMVYFTIMFDFTWSVSDCEELVGEFKEKSNHFFLHHLQ